MRPDAEQRKPEKVYSFIILYSVPWGGHCMPHRATQRKHGVGYEAEGETGAVGQCLYGGFLGKE